MKYFLGAWDIIDFPQFSILFIFMPGNPED
jgi:hypothetical protein